MKRHDEEARNRTGVYSRDWGGRLAIPTPQTLEKYLAWLPGRTSAPSFAPID